MPPSHQKNPERFCQECNPYTIYLIRHLFTERATSNICRIDKNRATVACEQQSASKAGMCV
jgi:hypothetical protein